MVVDSGGDSESTSGQIKGNLMKTFAGTICKLFRGVGGIVGK